MKVLIPSRLLLLSTCAAGLCGSVLLVALDQSSGMSWIPRLASASAAGTPPTSFSDAEFPICGTPIITKNSTPLRFAAIQTEVPRAEMKAVTPSPTFVDTDPPLWPGLGSVSYKITTASAEAQTYFDQGLRLTYAFNHDEAQRSFRKAQKLDPACAMCFWGEALVLGPNINLPMADDAKAPAFAAAQKARALANNASPREQALIAAMVNR